MTTRDALARKATQTLKHAYVRGALFATVGVPQGGVGRRAVGPALDGERACPWIRRRPPA